MKKAFFLFLLSGITMNISAQESLKTEKKTEYNNSIKISAETFSIKDRAAFSIPKFNDQYGISYEHRIKNNWHAGIRYTFWRPWKDMWGINKTVGNAVFLSEGVLAGVSDLKAIDLSVMYKYNIGKHHVLNASAGISAARVKEYYIKNYSFGGDVMSYDVVEKNNTYTGIVPSIGYEYQFWKNRLNAGIDLRGRYYNRSWPAQYDIAIHAGVNF